MAIDEGVYSGELVEKTASEISGLLVQKRDGEVFDTLVYALREIMRNSVEHSNANRILICGQCQPAYDSVEFAILDEGVGIYDSLRRNPKLEVSCCENALDLSVQPGVSGTFIGSKRRKSLSHSEWDNSGYGLYVVSRLCQKGGFFALTSGNKSLSMGQKGIKFFDASHNGTAILLKFNLSKISELKSNLKSIIADGREIASKSTATSSTKASLMTKKLATKQ